MKARTLIILLILGITFVGCKSAKRLAMEGRYDQAFDRALSALRRQPNNAENIEILKLSFANANERNLSRINQLQAGNAANRWMEIADLYGALQNRHNNMAQILPFLPNHVQSSVRTFDYSSQLANARNRAADYNFDRGIALLKMNSKARAREAVGFFRQAQRFDPSDPEIARMINEATFLGTNHVLYVVNNFTTFPLPFDFMNRMSQIPNHFALSSSWVRYYTSPENIDFDFVVELNFESINVIPNRTDTRTSTHTKTIEGDWVNEYDRRGNVKTDANGNPIRRRQTQQIRCDVMVTTQTSSIFINARLNYIHGRTNRVVRSIPISLEQPFFHQFVSFRGDRRAVDNQVLSRLPRSERAMPFPSPMDLVQMSRERMAEMVVTALRNNDRIIRNSD